ncbi:unnamed protein product, partial [Mesorhabditis spiculigera]
MGAFLDKPKTQKTNFSGDGKDITYAGASMQGWRIDMEDAHVVEISMGTQAPFKEWAFFAVFDGHAGCVAAEQSAEHILKTLLETKEFMEVVSIVGENGGKLNEKATGLLEQGMKTGFLTLDQIIKERLAMRDTDRSGCTAVCAILTPTHIIIANLGDSRAVLSRAGEASFGTEDHKPYLDKERNRIVEAGGSVMIQRINGSLAVSRALGDFDYKSVPGLCPTKQLVSCEPDIYVLERKTVEQFLVLACDGIYDVMENEELCNFVQGRLQVSDDLVDVCNQVLDSCLHRGSRDNMTIILIRFPNAPKVDEEKRAIEEAWAAATKEKIEEILKEELQSAKEMKEEPVSISWVIRRLAARGEDIENGLAPHRLRAISAQVLAEQNMPCDH